MLSLDKLLYSIFSKVSEIKEHGILIMIVNDRIKI